MPDQGPRLFAKKWPGLFCMGSFLSFVSAACVMNYVFVFWWGMERADGWMDGWMDGTLLIRQFAEQGDRCGRLFSRVGFFLRAFFPFMLFAVVGFVGMVCACGDWMSGNVLIFNCRRKGFLRGDFESRERNSRVISTPTAAICGV